MALINEGTAAEVIGGMKAARSAAHEQIERGRTRLRSTSKTNKSRQTRQRIMDAATRLIIERRSVVFQMSEVSELCGMSKGSLYYYFSDRDELVAAVFDESVSELVEQIEGIAARAESARAALTGLFGEVAKRLREGSVLALAMTNGLDGGTGLSDQEVTTRLARVSQVIAAQIERAKTEGIVRRDVDSATAATFVLGGFLATAMVVARDATGDQADVLVAHLTDLVMNGVGEAGASLG